MTNVPARHRRLAAFFLGLFLSLLGMVTLHDVSHRAEAVPCAGIIQCDDASPAGSTVTTTPAVQGECALCQFVHTPFLDLTNALTLVVVLLALCEILARVSSDRWLFMRLSPQLRAPPALA